LQHLPSSADQWVKVVLEALLYRDESKYASSRSKNRLSNGGGSMKKLGTPVKIPHLERLSTAYETEHAFLRVRSDSKPDSNSTGIFVLTLLITSLEADVPWEL
jgi:hypothetical protein